MYIKNKERHIPVDLTARLEDTLPLMLVSWLVVSTQRENALPSLPNRTKSLQLANQYKIVQLHLPGEDGS